MMPEQAKAIRRTRRIDRNAKRRSFPRGGIKLTATHLEYFQDVLSPILPREGKHDEAPRSINDSNSRRVGHLQRRRCELRRERDRQFGCPYTMAVINAERRKDELREMIVYLDIIRQSLADGSFIETVQAAD